MCCGRWLLLTAQGGTNSGHRKNVPVVQAQGTAHPPLILRFDSTPTRHLRLILNSTYFVVVNWVGNYGRWYSKCQASGRRPDVCRFQKMQGNVCFCQKEVHHSGQDLRDWKFR